MANIYKYKNKNKKSTRENSKNQGDTRSKYVIYIRHFSFFLQEGKGKRKRKQRNYLKNKVPLASASKRRLIPAGGTIGIDSFL
jgi:hypothetical protein